MGQGIAVDASGNAYVAGQTRSTNFPTAHALQSIPGGGADAFVIKLNASGGGPVYSTYLGDSNDNVGQGIAVDASGNAYVTGYTLSSDFPITNALQSSNHGGADAFVTEINSGGSALGYSTYLGGSANDYGNAIAVDSSGAVYLAGQTASSDFPTASPYQSGSGGGSDAFVAKLWGTSYQVAGGRLDVSVGYADNLRPNPNLPTPWRGDPNTLYVVPPGQDPTTTYDSGAIRLDNTTASSVTVQAVTVTIHNSSEVYNLWGSFTIPPNYSAILAQTNGENFDTSDFPAGGSEIGATCATLAGPTNHPPSVSIVLADGTQATVTDTGHILDTGGIDQANACGLNESLAWRAIGTVGIGSKAANLILTASTATSFPAVNTPATIVANLKDAANILPLANVTAHFQVLSGPNAGLSGQGLTDSQGNTTFTDTSTVAGTDVLTASVTNASGGVLSSNPVTLTWTTPGTVQYAEALQYGREVTWNLNLDSKNHGGFAEKETEITIPPLTHCATNRKLSKLAKTSPHTSRLYAMTFWLIQLGGRI